MQLYDLYLQSKTICINPALIAFATEFHRPCLKILNSDIKFPKVLTKGVSLSEKNKRNFSSSQPSGSCSCPASRKTKCSAPASPHAQPHYLHFFWTPQSWECMEVRWSLLLLPCFPHCSRVLHAQDQALCLCKSLSSKYPQLCVLVTDCSMHHAALLAQNSL